MKKILIAVLLSMSLLLSACGNQPGAATTTLPATETMAVATTTAPTAPAIPTTAAPATETATTTASLTTATTTALPTSIAPTTIAPTKITPEQLFIAVESSPTSVKLTIPKVVLDWMNMKADDLMWQAYSEGISTIKANPDGSLTYDMTKKEYQELLAGFKKPVDESIKGIIADSEKAIISIKYNTKMTEFQIRLDRKKFTQDDYAATMSLQKLAMTYQLFLGIKTIDMGVVFKFIDNSTGKVLETVQPTVPTT